LKPWRRSSSSPGRPKPSSWPTRTPNLYYTRATAKPLFSTLWCVNLDTGENRKLADLPRRASVVAINADETLGAGTFIEGDANAGGAYDGTAALGRMTAVNLGEPANKGQMMATRLAAKLPMTMFTIDLRTGKLRPCWSTAPTG
jgi:oligogalacturonide lyase